MLYPLEGDGGMFPQEMYIASGAPQMAKNLNSGGGGGSWALSPKF